MDHGPSERLSGEQRGFDFEAAGPIVKLPPKLGPPVNRKLAAWLSASVEPLGESDGHLCAHCHRAILVDDDFGLKFGEHVNCFDS